MSVVKVFYLPKSKRTCGGTVSTLSHLGEARKHLASGIRGVWRGGVASIIQKKGGCVPVFDCGEGGGSILRDHRF